MDESEVGLIASCSISVMDDSTSIVDESTSFSVAGENENVVEELLGVSVQTTDEAYKLYNDYAFKMGFSVRKGKNRYKNRGTKLASKIFLCNKAGRKRDTRDKKKSYSKLDSRTNCKASIQFDLDDDINAWIVTKHVKEHNHDVCSPSVSHLFPSHRGISDDQLFYLKDMKDSEIHLSDGIRFLNKQSGGSPFLGFTSGDAYNKVAAETLKTLDGTYSNSLIQIFKRRQENERDYFHEFDLDGDSRLCSFFWRDARMKEDYRLFGDLLVHDTTYRTNKYDMICAPFLGMNHHGSNIMFGCGFLLNERIESFLWLFTVFLKSMGDVHPKTIMTDQSAAMSYAIAQVFNTSRHRICIWHLAENSKKHLKALRSLDGFVDALNFLLKSPNTEAGFNLHWNSLVTKYECRDNSWIDKLYQTRDKWCPAFSKDYFSISILSSQRSESTNHAVSRRLTRTAGLTDFYKIFTDIISEWRSKERAEDLRCSRGVPEMAMDHVKLLSHVREVYTIEVYSLFDKQFLKSNACFQTSVYSDHQYFKYHVWIPDIDFIQHAVDFHIAALTITCSCKMFTEVGILCSHSIRILNLHCVSVIPQQYILKRWTKKVIEDRNVKVPSIAPEFQDAPSVWRIQMERLVQTLLYSSENNIKARKGFENAIEAARKTIEAAVEPIFFDESDLTTSNDVIQNPRSSRSLGVRNRRVKSVTEKKCNQAKGRKGRANANATLTKKAVQSSVEGILSGISGDGYIVHPSARDSELTNFNTNPASSSHCS